MQSPLSFQPAGPKDRTHSLGFGSRNCRGEIIALFPVTVCPCVTQGLLQPISVLGTVLGALDSRFESLPCPFPLRDLSKHSYLPEAVSPPVNWSRWPHEAWGGGASSRVPKGATRSGAESGVACPWAVSERRERNLRLDATPGPHPTPRPAQHSWGWAAHAHSIPVVLYKRGG